MSVKDMSLNELSAYLERREELDNTELEQLQADPRRGAREMLYRHLRREQERRRESERLQVMLTEERLLWNEGLRLVAGVDEAGRGPLAGPVVAAAVILPPETTVATLNDSKQLSPAARDSLFMEIMRLAVAVSTGVISEKVIDQINIYRASMEAMREALENLALQPEAILVDGFPIPALPLRQKAIKGGDASSLSIAAASVVAKVTRDRIMLDLHRLYPGYSFDRNKGYATAEHRMALSRRGPCPAHRLTFRLDSWTGEEGNK